MNCNTSANLKNRLEAEKTAQNSISNDKTSVSYPYTRCNPFSATKLSRLGTRHINFQPIRIDVMRELLKCSDTPPKIEEKNEVPTKSGKSKKSSQCINFSENIDDSTDDDKSSDETKDDTLDRSFCVSPTKPIQSVKPVITISQNSLMPMANIFSKLSLDDVECEKETKDVIPKEKLPQNFPSYLSRKDEDKKNIATTKLVRPTTSSTIKEVKLPRSYLATPNQRIQCSIRSTVKENVKSHSNFGPMKGEPIIEFTPRRDQNMPLVKKIETPNNNQNQVNKNYATPKQNIPSNSLMNLEYSKQHFDNNMKTPVNKEQLKTPRINMPSSSIMKSEQPKQPAQTSAKKTEIALREQNLNNLIVESSKNSSDSTENQKEAKRNVQFSMPIPNSNLPYKSVKSLVVRGKEYIIISKLGEGGSCQVYNCLEPKTLQNRAIKIVNLMVDPVTANAYVNEVKMLSSMQSSEHVIKMYDYELTKQTLYVVMEKGDIDLSVLLRNTASKTQLIPAHLINYYWVEMLYCVKEIHDNGIIHSDLKPSNFLIVQGRLKLIDFGIASRLSADTTSIVKNVQMGTFNYISPEALQDPRSEINPADTNPRIRISYKSDVWSLGCILYQMVYRRTPFQSYGFLAAKMAAIMDQNHEIPYPPVDHVDQSLVNIIKKCLIYDMTKRPTVDELINMDICRSRTTNM